MSTIKDFQKELEQEASTTQKMLSVIPDDKYNWKPHPKSMTIKQLVTHIADLPSWIDMVFNTTELDFATSPYKPEEVNDTKTLMNYFEKNLTLGKKALANGKEEQLKEKWILRNGDKILGNNTKEEVFRMVMSQIIHHRAQLGVFLRLLDVPIPGSYGPSADEMKF